MEKLTPPTPAEIDNRPEFVDAKNATKLFGLSRSYLYKLRDEGRITAVCIRRPGNVRGRRLFDAASLRSFIQSAIETR